MNPFESRGKIAELAGAVTKLASHLEKLEALIADRAPASGVERLNHAIDLIADQVPRSEIERLEYAFELEQALEVSEAIPGDPAGLRLVEFLSHAFLSPLDYVVLGYKA